MLTDLVRRLSYVPAVRHLVGATGLRGVAQKIYKQSFGSADGVLPLSFGGSHAKFATPTIRELRGIQYFAIGEDGDFRQLVGMIAPGDVFFDIGAQYGAYAYLISNALPSVKVVAFEPFPRDYVFLKQNAGLNPQSHVQCINAALSDFDGEVWMTAVTGDAECCPKIVTSKDGQRVPAMRGDTLIASGELPFPNVLKLDVEGHEMAVLRGLDKALADPRLHSIYCEIHDDLLPQGETAAALIAYLESKGFHSIVECPAPNHYVFAEKRTPATTIH
jgi:FkbM family methyltransferase